MGHLFYRYDLPLFWLDAIRCDHVPRIFYFLETETALPGVRLEPTLLQPLENCFDMPDVFLYVFFFFLVDALRLRTGIWRSSLFSRGFPKGRPRT